MHIGRTWGEIRQLIADCPDLAEQVRQQAMLLGDSTQQDGANADDADMNPHLIWCSGLPH